MTSKEATKNKDGFTKAEQDAMKARAKELKAEARANKKKEEGEKNLFEKVAEMPEPDRSMATRLHEIIMETAPDLWPKTWYGMPAYTTDGKSKVVFFFQSASKFEARYATFGFNDTAMLDDGNMWPTAFALKKLTAAEEKKIIALVRKAIN